MADATRVEHGHHEATVRYSTHGVAHVAASSWADLGFGQGWACARDHLGTIADQIVKVRSERSLFHGPGAADAHLASDFGYLSLGVAEHAVQLRAAQPAWIRDLVTGYVAGYNLRVGEVLVDASLVPQWCRGAPWIRPIDELDLYAYLGDVALMASGRNLAELIGWAQPPGPDGPYPPAPMEALGSTAPASNGWAFGGDATASGGGAVLANPHFPWFGEARFWECHLTLDGQMDVYGVSLLGLPGVQIGFNRGLAWTHTFSKGHRFTLYRLELAEDRPTAYLRRGEQGIDEVEMTSRQHSVQVLSPDGSTTQATRTMWRTQHGPMLNMPLLGWGEQTAFSYRDANSDNTVVLEQFLRMGMAEDMDSFQEVFGDVKGMPWVNTLAADSTGRAWYCDASATPALSESAQTRFRRRLDEDLIAALMHQNRIALLEGSEPDDDWLDHDGARSPGLEPPERLPQMERRDVLVNANDSHWLSHPTETLEGYPVLCGLERVPQSLRTRQNLLLAGALADTAAVTVDSILETLFADTSLSATLLRDAVVQRCRAAELDLVADVLEAWDGAARLDSVGVVLWREIMNGFSDEAWRDGSGLFETTFDHRDPLGTPHTLLRRAEPTGTESPDAAVTDPVIDAVAAAVERLGQAAVPIDAALGEVQWAQRGAHRIAVHGGGEAEGVANVLAPTGALASSSLEPRPAAAAVHPGCQRTGLADGGYQVTYGTSFLMAVELTDRGPTGRGLLAYGQSEDPASPHHRDGTEAYAASGTRPLLFDSADIDADPQLVVVQLSDATGT